MIDQNSKQQVSLVLSQASDEQRKAMANEIQRRVKCLAYCYRQVKEAFQEQQVDEQAILQSAFFIFDGIVTQSVLKTA